MSSKYAFPGLAVLLVAAVATSRWAIPRDAPGPVRIPLTAFEMRWVCGGQDEDLCIGDGGSCTRGCFGDELDPASYHSCFIINEDGSAHNCPRCAGGGCGNNRAVYSQSLVPRPFGQTSSRVVKTVYNAVPEADCWASIECHNGQLHLSSRCDEGECVQGPALSTCRECIPGAVGVWQTEPVPTNLPCDEGPTS